jgi:hypothetical protein
LFLGLLVHKFWSFAANNEFELFNVHRVFLI